MIFSVDVKEAKFGYGDKLYRIEKKRAKIFNEPCKVCDEAKKITYRGLTFNCPFCCDYRNNRTFIEVREFEISEYFINKITIEGEPIKKNFAPSAIFDNPPRVRYEAFTRNGNGYDDTRTAKVNDRCIDPVPEDYIKFDSRDYFFIDKKKAKETLELMQKREREKFEAFCKENNCNYEFPF